MREHIRNTLYALGLFLMGMFLLYAVLELLIWAQGKASEDLDNIYLTTFSYLFHSLFGMALLLPYILNLLMKEGEWHINFPWFFGFYIPAGVVAMYLYVVTLTGKSLLPLPDYFKVSYFSYLLPIMWGAFFFQIFEKRQEDASDPEKVENKPRHSD